MNKKISRAKNERKKREFLLSVLAVLAILSGSPVDRHRILGLGKSFPLAGQPGGSSIYAAVSGFCFPIYLGLVTRALLLALFSILFFFFGCGGSLMSS